jgi:hypothetical protein
MARTAEGKASDAIREALANEPGLALYRNSVGLFKSNGCTVRAGLGGANASKRTKGAADTIGTLAITVRIVTRAGEHAIDVGRDVTLGRAIALEIKAPAIDPETGLPILDPVETLAELRELSIRYASKKLPKALEHSLNQALWAEDWRTIGHGFYAIVRTPEEARAAIARARAGALE